MASIVQNCPNQPEDLCTRLAREIDEMVNRDRPGKSGTKGLKFRFKEQIEGPNGPGSDVWNRHEKAIKEQQKGLQNRLDKFDKNNCGDKIPVSADAREWANKPVPAASEWKGGTATNYSAEPDTSSAFMKKMAEITGLSGTALLIYVIVSEGSRVFIPRNAIPVP